MACARANSAICAHLLISHIKCIVIQHPGEKSAEPDTTAAVGSPDDFALLSIVKHCIGIPLPRGRVGDAPKALVVIKALFYFAAIETKLDEEQIEKAAKLEADLFEVSHAFKTKPFVEPKRRNIVCIDSSDHDVLSEGRGARYQRPHKGRADASPQAMLIGRICG